MYVGPCPPRPARLCREVHEPLRPVGSVQGGGLPLEFRWPGEEREVPLVFLEADPLGRLGPDRRVQHHRGADRRAPPGLHVINARTPVTVGSSGNSGCAVSHCCSGGQRGDALLADGHLALIGVRLVCRSAVIGRLLTATRAAAGADPPVPTAQRSMVPAPWPLARNAKHVLAKANEEAASRQRSHAAGL